VAAERAETLEGPALELPIEQLRRRATAKWSRYGPDVLPLWVAEMDLATAEPIVAAVADCVRREELGYPRGDAGVEVGEALAAWSAEHYGWVIDPARVHLVPDVLKGVELAIDNYSPPGSPMILPTPAYMPFWEIPDLIDHPIVKVPCQQVQGCWQLDLDGIAAAFAGGAGTLLLCNPYNPLGRAFTRDELLAVAALVTAAGARVVSDEIHAPLVYDRPHVPYASVSAEAAAHSITVTSASKGWNLPGLLCAEVVITNDADDEVWRQLPHLKTHGTSPLGIAAHLAAYRHGGPWLEAALAHLDRNRRLLGELLAAHLPGAGYVMPEGTYLAWLDFRSLHLPAEPAELFLDRARVALNPGLDFGDDGAGHARLNFATSAAILEQAVTAMAAAVAGIH
jgi:cystathionine beta-lyase